MSDSREDSPDWVRSFQPPTASAIELSSGSESPLNQSPVSDDEDTVNLSRLFKKDAKSVSDFKDNDDVRETLSDSPVKVKSPNKGDKLNKTPKKRRKKDDASERGKRTRGKDSSGEKSGSILSLSSDSKSPPDPRPVKKSKTSKKELTARKDLDQEDKKEKRDSTLNNDVESLENQTPKVKSPVTKLEKEDEKSFMEKNMNSSIKEDDDIKDNSVKENISGKHPGHQVSSSRLPLLLSEKVQRTKALVECEGDSIDLSGDMGSVGRIVISDDSSKQQDMFLDLKGTIYKTTIVPSRTFCVVSFNQSEAKIEAIMNDYIQLKSQSSIYEAETMIEGTLDGFTFDSDEEADKTIVEADQQEAAEENSDVKTKKRTDKKPSLEKKKGKPTGEKPSKTVKRKPQVSKKGKAKK